MQLLGKGAFGCVISNFKFSCGKKYPFPTVQKIIGKGVDEKENVDAKKRREREERISEIIRKKIKDWKIYFSVALDTCDLKDDNEIIFMKNIWKNKEIPGEIKKCFIDISEKKGKEYNKYEVQIIPKIGGSELYKAPTYKMKMDEYTFLNFSKHLIRGLNKLHKQNIIHFDIKRENIMWNFSKNFNKNFTLVYIDFGLSKILDDLTDEKLRKIEYGTAIYESPEVFLFKPIFSSLLLKSDSRSQMSAFSGLQLIDSNRKKEIEMAFEYFFSVNELKHMFSYKNISYIKNLIQNGERKQLIKLAKLKDVFALGVSLTEICIQINLEENIKIKELLRNMISFNFTSKEIPHRKLTSELLDIFDDI